MNNNFDNIEGDYVSLGRFGNSFFDISNDNNNGSNANNINSFREYIKLGGKKLPSLLRFLVLLGAIISLLVLVKLPIKNRVELRKEMLDRALLERMRYHNDSAIQLPGNNTVGSVANETLTGTHKGETKAFVQLQNESSPERSVGVENNNTMEVKDRSVAKNSISIQKDIKLDMADSFFGSHYNIHGVNKKAAENDICSDKDYTKKVLKLVYELSYFALPKDTMNIRKFEASDVKVFKDEMWVVCDNSWMIGKFGLSLTPFSDSNKLLGMQTTTSGGNPLDISRLLLGTDPNTEDSQWEGIVRDDVTGHLFVIRESIPHYLNGNPTNVSENLEELKLERPGLAKHYHSHIIELAVVKVNNVESYEVLETCTAEQQFEFDNKGFEGAVGLRTRAGEYYLLGLCEGNYCMGETKGEESGNGRLILMKKEYISRASEVTTENTPKNDIYRHNSKCIWRSIRMINIPKEANFQDYSSIDIRGNKVAITSQEDSSMWIGEIYFGDGEYLDPEKIQLLPNGRVYYFPRDHDCDFKYCNIEGVSFISDNMVVTVSDKMKKKNRQSPKCIHKDQSIHIFAIP
ncbi:putative transmembrane domain-containing protein [Cryptosporidium canis]|uniref:Transmembrane domain-containing protein n=1 Tax=Cryptosporidium canis TaxID=195482 RepID=A0A9D5DH32_9CRYT|nr:putative transmembrane domain-containing protein [Cryptosporidium canis]